LTKLTKSLIKIILYIKKSNFGQMIRGMSMPYVYYLIQTKKKIVHSLSPQRILMGIGLGLIGSGIGIVEFVRRLYSNKKKTT
jgi:hypothetical protein